MAAPIFTDKIPGLKENDAIKQPIAIKPNVPFNFTTNGTA
jgi:hypothetical protein